MKERLPARETRAGQNAPLGGAGAGGGEAGEGHHPPGGVVVGGPPSSRVVRAGESFTFEPSDIHRVTHVEGEPAVTIHVYSPPLHAMGAYDVTEEGRLRRTAISAETSLSA